MAYDFKNLTVLVVDDEASMRVLLKTVFQRLQIKECADAASAENGLQLFEDKNFDIVISDFNMAGTNGIDFLKAARKIDKNRGKLTPILLTSGYVDLKLLRDALNAGATEFLSKPFSVNDLANRVAYTLNTPRACIDIPEYYGPDRRRKQHPNFKGPFKRAEDK